jgi:hypothetical protein
MSVSRSIKALVVLAFVVIGAFTIQSAVATAPTVSSVKDLSDYALRHPNAVIPDSAPDLSDYALRHPGATISIAAEPDLSDYALRHRDEIRQMTQPDLSDYALRHPEAMGPARR